MLVELSNALLRHVYYPITAVISMDTYDQMIDLVLIDSLFAPSFITIAPKAAVVDLIFSHPNGRKALEDEELRLIHRIAAQHTALEIRAYLYNEDAGLTKVDIMSNLRYNDENAI